MVNLFKPIVDPERYHPNFERMLSTISAEVREVVQSWADGFVDRDGKFVTEFQTSFNSSFWEIYLHAVLRQLGIDIDYRYESPDFVATNINIVIEAVVASHANNEKAEWERSLANMMDKETWDAFSSAAIRLSNAFHSKVTKYRKHYLNLPQCADKSFVIAIGNYSATDFFLHGDVSLQWLLFDVLNLKQLRKQNGAEVELGMFRTDAFSDISAILYSSVATTGKARALSNDFKSVFNAIRIKDDNEIIQIVESRPKYQESLCDGLRLFINPFAKKPIDLSHFDDNDIRVLVGHKNGDYTYSSNDDGYLQCRFVQIPELKK